jgi:hypothetical protein
MEIALSKANLLLPIENANQHHCVDQSSGNTKTRSSENSAEDRKKKQDKQLGHATIQYQTQLMLVHYFDG